LGEKDLLASHNQHQIPNFIASIEKNWLGNPSSSGRLQMLPEEIGGMRRIKGAGVDESNDLRSIEMSADIISCSQFTVSI